MDHDTLIPWTVEKCTVSSNAFEQMYKDHQQNQSLSDTSNARPFMERLKSLNLNFNELTYVGARVGVTGDPLTTELIWEIISKLPSLEELSFSGYFDRYYFDFTRSTKCFDSIKKLRLDVDLPFEDVSNVIREFRRLEIFDFDLSSSSKAYKYRDRLSHFHLPPTLREFYAHGNVMGLSTLTLNRVLWMRLFKGCEDAPSLKIVTQDYSFENSTAPMGIAPTLRQSYREFIGRVGCDKFPSMYFFIQHSWQWSYLQTHLRAFPHLEHLNLYVWLVADTESALQTITKADPPIETSIKQLTIDDNHFNYGASFNVLSSFANVKEYVINCDAGSQFYKSCLEFSKSSVDAVSWSLSLTCGPEFPLDKLADFSRFKKLSLNRFKLPADLDALSETAPCLEEIVLRCQPRTRRRINCFSKLRRRMNQDDCKHGDGNSTEADDVAFYCFNPLEIDRCFFFPYLRRARFWGMLEEEFVVFKKRLAAILADEEYHRQWPSNLEEVTFAFDFGLDRKNPEIKVIKDEFRVKILAPTIPSGGDENCALSC